MEPEPGDTHPYADTEAARMLRDALQRVSTEGLSLRQLARKLNYKQATVLSHMANGRVAIPMKKAGEIAEATGMTPSAFIMAVADQRQPQRFSLTTKLEANTFSVSADGFVEELEAIAGAPLDLLTTEQKLVMREVVSQPDPSRRWLAPAEVPAVQLLRSMRPDFQRVGLDRDDRTALRSVLSK